MPPGSEPASGSVSPKQPIHSPGRELRQVFSPLAFVAVGPDRIHDERRLHAHHRAIAGIDALHLARDQPVGDIGGAGAAVVLRQRQPEQPERAHLAKNLGVGLLFAIGLDDARQRASPAHSRARVSRISRSSSLSCASSRNGSSHWKAAAPAVPRSLLARLRHFSSPRPSSQTNPPPRRNEGRKLLARPPRWIPAKKGCSDYL